VGNQAVNRWDILGNYYGFNAPNIGQQAFASFFDEGDYLQEEQFFLAEYRPALLATKNQITDYFNGIIAKGCPGRRYLLPSYSSNWEAGKHPFSIGGLTNLVIAGTRVKWDSWDDKASYWRWEAVLLITDNIGVDYNGNTGEKVLATVFG
jgi:hypothetical protein